MKVDFVSYSGRYPNLCRGILKLMINDELHIFGDYSTEEWVQDENGVYHFKDEYHHDKILVSTGSCGFTENYSKSFIKTGKWEIDRENLPEQFTKDMTEKRKEMFIRAIEDVVNENIPFGCCGGCI